MTAISRREFFRAATADGVAPWLLTTAGSTLCAAPLGLPIGSQTYPHRALIKSGNVAALAATLAGIGVKSLVQAAKAAGVKNYLVEQNMELTKASVAYLATLAA